MIKLKIEKQIIGFLGRGGCQVVSVLAFCSDDLSLNPAEAYSFSVKYVFEKNENKQKEARVGPFFKKNGFGGRTVVYLLRI